MSFNPAEQQLDNRVAQEVKRQRIEMLQFKNAQPIGADVLAIDKIPSGGPIFAGPLTVPAGSGGIFIITCTPAHNTLTQWDFLHSLTVDGTSSTLDLFPFGANMTTEKRKVRFSSSVDWATSSDTSNVRVFHVRVENFGTTSHDYYIYARFYIPRLSGTGAS